MLSLKKRGKTWYAEGQADGQRIHKSLKTRDIVVARGLLRDLETRILSNGRLVAKSWASFADEFAAWVSTTVKTGHDSTLSRYTFVLNRFGRFLEAKAVRELADVNSEVLAAYGEDRLHDVHPCTRREATPATVASDMRILHRVFSYAVGCGYLVKNPVKWLKARRGGHTQPYSEAEIAAMLQDRILVQRPMLRAVVTCFVAHRFENFGRVRFAGEGRGRRQDHHEDELKAALELYFQCRTDAQRESPYVFSKPDGTQLDRRALTSTMVRLFARCGIKGGHVHRFRDTFAVRLLQQGASLFDVSKLLGINMSTAEKFYAPYSKELQDRGPRLVFALHSPGVVTKSFDPPESGKVVQFCAPLSPILPRFGEQQANEDESAVKAKP